MLHGQILDEVKTAKYLGITISDDISWNRHIEKSSLKDKQQQAGVPEA